MTADPKRRRRASRLALGGLLVGAVAVVVLAVVAVATLRSSEEGTDVTPPERPSQQFPPTPLAIVGVVDDERLTSLVVAALDPSGVGGSLVTVPVNLDTSTGLGDERTPLARRAFVDGDTAAFDEELAPTLGIEPSFSVVLSAGELEALLADLGEVVVTAREDVVDASDGVSEVVIESGDRRVDVDTLVAALTAIGPPEQPSYETHALDVAVWDAIAERWSERVEVLDLPLDESGAPLPPATFEEMIDRLRAGRVEVRDLAIDRVAAITLDNPDDADFVLLDQFDARLVFASIAPARVLTPNPSLTFSIVAPFNRSQLAVVGDDVTTSELVRELIGELLFVGANVVSVDTRPAEAGAATGTEVIVDEEEFLSDAVVPDLIGPSTTRIAARATDGSDVTLVLGTDFLDERVARREAREAQRSDDDGAADFDVSGGGVDADESGDTADDDAEGDTVDGDE